MSMGICLRVIRDTLRTTHGWHPRDCRPMPRGEPPENHPSEWFVGIDEAGVDSGPDDFYGLQETYRVDIWVWRKLGQYPKDELGTVLLDEDPHLANILLPEDLERKVIKTMHFSYAIMNAINVVIDPSAENGSGLNQPFRYQGRGRTTTTLVNDGGGGQSWAGRALRFGGAKRTQTIECLG